MLVQRSTCDCGASCCDGYTEFCCSLTGHGRTMPGGHGARRLVEGRRVRSLRWGPPLLHGLQRGAAGQPLLVRLRQRQLRAAQGLLHPLPVRPVPQEIATMGAIMCRVVTCTAPWEFDPTCTRTVLTDNNTRFHDAPCLHARPSRPGACCATRHTWGPPTAPNRFGMTNYVHLAGDWTGKGYDSIGAWDPATGTFTSRNANTDGAPDIVVQYGARGYVPLVGDWNGDGTDTIGVWDPPPPPSTSATRTPPALPTSPCATAPPTGSPSSATGTATAPTPSASGTPPPLPSTSATPAPPARPTPPSGTGRGATPRWWATGTAPGVDGVGAFVDGVWSLSQPRSTSVVRYGSTGTKPARRRLERRRADSIGVVAPNGIRPSRPTPTTWALRNQNSGGSPTLAFTFGMSDYDVIVGDWNGDGVEGIGVRDPLTRAIHLRQTASAGAAETDHQRHPRHTVAGRWLGPGAASVGWYADGTWRLRRTLAAGSPIDTIRFGAPGWIPLVGDWNGDGTDTIGVWDPPPPPSTCATPTAPEPPHLGALRRRPAGSRWWATGTATAPTPSASGTPATATFHLRNSNTPGNPDLSIDYGTAGYRPIVGDWDGNGTDTIGVLF